MWSTLSFGWNHIFGYSQSTSSVSSSPQAGRGIKRVRTPLRSPQKVHHTPLNVPIKDHESQEYIKESKYSRRDDAFDSSPDTKSLWSQGIKLEYEDMEVDDVKDSIFGEYKHRSDLRTHVIRKYADTEMKSLVHPTNEKSDAKDKRLGHGKNVETWVCKPKEPGVIDCDFKVVMRCRKSASGERLWSIDRDASILTHGTFNEYGEIVPCHNPLKGTP